MPSRWHVITGFACALIFTLLFCQDAGANELLASISEPVPIAWHEMRPVRDIVAEWESEPRNTRWTPEHVRAALTEACGRYGVPTDWIVEVGVRVCFRESGGRWWVVNSGGYAGLFQFGTDWGKLSLRTDPAWSCDRFVRVYRDGGKAKIQQHWAATI